MEPDVFVYASPWSLEQVAWMCLEMPVEGVMCGWAFMWVDPFQLIATFQGWLL